MRNIVISSLVSAALLLFAGGCVETSVDGELATSQMAMGMSWPSGWGDPPAGTVPAPTVTPLDELSVLGMRAPLRVAVSDTGAMAVTDPKASKVFLLDPLGRLQSTITTVRQPMGVAFGPGCLFVGDAATGSVVVFDDDGTARHLGPGRGAFETPNEIVYDPATNIVFVVDSGRDVVLGYDPSGQLVSQFGGIGSGPGQFHFPTGLALTPDGELLVVDHSNARVQTFTSDGVWLRSMGRYGDRDGRLARPQGVAVDAEGRIYVVDTYQGRVQIFDEAGTHVGWLGEAGQGPGELWLPMDVAIDRFDRVIVTAPGRGTVLVYGLDNYTVPVSAIDVSVTLNPRATAFGSRGRWLKATIDVPPELAAVELSSLRLSGIGPDPAGPSSNGLWPNTSRAVAFFSRRAVLATVAGPGTYDLELTGNLASGQPIQGVASLRVVTNTNGAK